ncbi:L-aspartate oxidase [Halococcoides cellulosivorans]|uniref:L-aspartate oxidase n=1 Tax=Halococcoides cellulosivorans TaxID=1679096 RepID=A0A2R4WYE4_9EURY|nr:FAD-dependent oxidoreductase [Halococcoides cellulosivorans]AWB26553.1 aspartate oxidase [Halococcoides cellulosivorans]
MSRVLVIGSGIAGCAAALGAARAGSDVDLVTTATEPRDTATWWAQGGIAVPREDERAFVEDIVTASDGTADRATVESLVGDARAAVEDVLVETAGVDFDRDGEEYDFSHEAGHARPRVLHVDAATGQSIEQRLFETVARRSAVTVRTDTAALDLLVGASGVGGAVLEGREPIRAGGTVLATGGIGGLYPETTNPPGATGDGIAMAAQAGADLADLPFVQFHPTVYLDGETLLVSEAVRGAGAVLWNADGERFMPSVHPDAELAPRDVVARAVARERDRTGRVTLDVSAIPFRAEFPGLADRLADRGVDPDAGIPVGPAQHFLCGGIAVDERGRTSVPGLFAAGECARTGVHGANRLASTSLLEGLVWGLRAGRAAAGSEARPAPDPSLPTRDPDLPAAFAAEKRRRLQQIVGEHLGIERSPAGLKRAVSALGRLRGELDAYTRTRSSRSLNQLYSATITAESIARAARATDSVGTHRLEATRAD